MIRKKSIGSKFLTIEKTLTPSGAVQARQVTFIRRQLPARRLVEMDTNSLKRIWTFCECDQSEKMAVLFQRRMLATVSNRIATFCDG